MDNLSKYAELFKQVRQEHQSRESLDINDNILVIDGLNTFIRVWSVVPALNEDGYHIGGITGFLKSIGTVIRQFRPTRVIIVFDGKGGSIRRKKLFPEYKAGRKRKKLNLNRPDSVNNPELEEEQREKQFIRLIEYLKCLPVTMITQDNIEADDVMAFIGTTIYPESRITYLSSDKDFLQLINDRIQVWAPVKKRLITKSNIEEETGVPYGNWLNYRLFIGDTSDGIPGVKGVGVKGIRTKLPMLFEKENVSINDVIEYCEANAATIRKSPNIYQRIIDQKDIIARNFQLMQLSSSNISGEVMGNIRRKLNGKVNELDRSRLTELFTKDKIYTGIPDFQSWISNTWESVNYYVKQKKAK